LLTVVQFNRGDTMAKKVKGVSFNLKDPRERNLLKMTKDHNFSGLVKSLLFLHFSGGDVQKKAPKATISIGEAVPASKNEIRNSGIPFG
jgi:hypothetical protein